MRYDINKLEATPNKNSLCPGCGAPIISKCGEINIWHWAHKNSEDCDSWYEPETMWHREWKNHFPKENQEVVVGCHRADIKTKSGLIVEIQASPISIGDIVDREVFYGNMIWVVKADEFRDRMSIGCNPKNYWTFKWKHARKCWLIASRPVYLDFGEDSMFLIKKLYPSGGGWGYYIDKEEFIKNHV